jgi:hypothetical protein
MSNTAMKAFLFMIAIVLGTAGCTREMPEPDLTLGRPALGTAATSGNPALSRLEISARPPGTRAWNVRLERGINGTWRIESRSDLPGDPGDLADTKLVDHFLEILGTFNTEAPSGGGNDAVFGMNPPRMEIRLGEPKGAKVIRLGETTGPNGIYFRVGSDSTTTAVKTWIGRGALLAFLPILETPDSFVEKSPYFAPIETIQSVSLAKLEGKDRGSWEFNRDGPRWFDGKVPLDEAKGELVERIFRQRLVHVLPAMENPDLAHPDWKITVRTAEGEETLTIAFLLNSVYARNAARSNRALELYPEIAGALRAFTQARFTPRKSGTK